MRARSAALLFALTLLIPCGLLASPSPTLGDDAVAAPVAKLDTMYVHPGFAAAVVVHPRHLLASPLVKAVPAEQLTQALEKAKAQSSIDPNNIEQLMFLVGPPAADGDEGVPMTPGVIVRFHEPIDQKALVEKMVPKAVEAESGGKKYLRSDQQRPPAGVYFADNKTLLFAPEKSLQKMLATGAGQGPLAEAMTKADGAHDVVAVGVMAPVKQMLTAAAQDAKERLDPKLRVLASFPEHLKAAVFSADLDGANLLHLLMEGNDEDGANALQNYAIVARDAIKGALAASRPQLQQSLPPDAAGPVLKIIDDLQAGLKIKQDGTQVTISIKTPDGWKDLPKTLAPLIEQQRRKAAAMQRMMGLRMIGIAEHMYHDSYQQLAPDIVDKEGKPLLSWRVRMLPYLEAKNLYDQFKLDEPWDSENNKKLIEKMPALFGENKQGNTSVFVFTGEGTLFPTPGKSVSFAAVKDGMSNTILLVQAGEDKAVPWTKPSDLPLDKNNPVAALGKLPDGKFPAVYGDIHLDMLDAKLDPAKLTSLILIADGGPATMAPAFGRPPLGRVPQAAPAPDSK